MLFLFTRAQEALIVIGDLEYFSKVPVMRDVLAHIADNQTQVGPAPEVSTLDEPYSPSQEQAIEDLEEG